MNKKIKTIKVMTIVGTRPEIIRLSLIISLLDKYLNHIFVHTGQNYDYELNQIFFNDLKIRKPDYFLQINTSTVGNSYGDTLIKTEKVLLKEKPDAVLILGDTNSSIACIIAKRLKIPIFHMEAGNRCYDMNVPEEMNRIIIDHISDFNLVYTEHARRHLLTEGLPHRRIFLTGSPLQEVIHHYINYIDNSYILNKLKLLPNKYFLVSSHREENVDNTDNLKTIFYSINKLVNIYNVNAIVSTHPRTKIRLSKINLSLDPRIIFFKPFGFFEYICLQKNALCTISDSGSICEESAILNFPAVTIRNSMERPEALDSGSIILTGIDIENILSSVHLAIQEKQLSCKNSIPIDYTIENTSWRVLKLILGTAKLSNKWSGIKINQF